MQRYQQTFQALKANNAGAFVPFVTLGDPSLPASEQVIEALIAGGADALELGLPFSDPVADGPVIQAANLRALNSGIKIKDCFELLTRIRAKHPNLPIGLLVYCNLVHAVGLTDFYLACAAAGVDSVLIADLPLREAQPFQAAAKQAGIQSVFICPPDASQTLAQAVAAHSEGYIYLLSRAGVTGTGETLPTPDSGLLKNLKSALQTANKNTPILLGFGISQPEHVAQAIQLGVEGAISGSASVRLIETYQAQPDKLYTELFKFAQAMKTATQIR